MKIQLENLKPDLILTNITELTPELLKVQGLEGAIFDLDDTLMPERSGRFSETIFECLKNLQEHGLKTGIITNNFSSKYCEAVRNLLAEENLFIPMIENAYKPDILCFQQMLDFFELKPEKVAMVGDGIFTDTYGAHKMGMFAVRVRWFSKSLFKRGFLLSLRELIVCFSDLIRRYLFGHKMKQYHMTKSTAQKSYLFLVNPKSGSDNAEEAIKAIQNTFTDLTSSASYKIHECHKFDDLKKSFANDIQAGKYQAVIAVGGDGTVREAISLIQNNWSTVLGIIPTGTGNLFAKSLGIPGDIQKALEIILLGKMQRINIGRANNNYLTLCVGAGIDANVMKSTTSEQKKALGVIAYCVQAFKQLINPEQASLLINIDGKNIFTRGIGLIAINRNNYIQAFLPQIKPENNENNKALDICVLKPQKDLDYLTALGQLFMGTYKGSTEPIQYLEGQKIKVNSWPRLNVQVDGDYIGKTPVDIEFLCKRLAVFIP